MNNNDIFHASDPHTGKLLKWGIPPSWWSRVYEYPWAFGFARSGATVADMGCGYEFRPFKNALAEVCHKVYAIDSREAARQLQTDQPALEVKIADMTNTGLPERSLDTIFCISVLEEVNAWEDALAHWRTLIRPTGRLVLTFDTSHDLNKPAHDLYRGMDLPVFWGAAYRLGWIAEGPISADMNNAVFNETFNLACYHCVLRPQ